MLYFKNEKYLLPFSHDEVVHGKATIVQKMNGQYEEKFPQAKAMYLYMMVHPGKKLNFMGNEIGQLREWDEKREQDWDLRQYPVHDSFYHYMAELNCLYLKHLALSEWDYREEGFRWLDCHQEKRCIYAILRECEQECLVAIFNFSNQAQKEYEVRLEKAKGCDVLLYTDWEHFGGKTPKTQCSVVFKRQMLVCELMPYSAVLIQIHKKETSERMIL